MFVHISQVLSSKFCCHCQTGRNYLCDVCYELLHFYTFPITLSLESPHLTQIFATAEYAPPLASVIQSLKYHHIKGIGKWCAELMYSHAQLPSVDYLVPVPLSAQRWRERGYNQASEISTHLGQLLRIPSLPLLQRVKHTSPQAMVADQEQRKTRLTNCFGLDPSQPLPPSDARIGLVDDVVTTGSTINECAGVLRQLGYTQVVGLTVAHGS